MAKLLFKAMSLYETWLTVHSHRWSIMSRAIKGAGDWGWDFAFVATEFVILDNFVEVGTGQIGVGN